MSEAVNDPAVSAWGAPTDFVPQQPELGPVTIDSTAQIERLIQSGCPTLVFPVELEQRFLHDTAADRLRVMVGSMMLVIVLFNGYLLSDWYMIPDVFHQAMVIRLGVFTPGCFAMLYLLHKVTRPRVREFVLMLGGLAGAAVAVYMPSISHDAMAGPYLVCLANTVMFLHAVVQMRFWFALVMDVIVLMLFATALLYVPPFPVAIMIPVLLVLLSTMTFNLYGCYTVERDERMSWLHRAKEAALTSALKDANERLDRLSRSDLLTQVANRRHFDEFLTQVWNRAARDGSPVALLLIDVDHFKAFNDRYGHPVGDECLRQVASTLKRHLRRPGDLVARFGGEEFVVVLPGLTLETAMQAAERVREAVERLAQPHAGSTTAAVVTVSMGVASMTAHDPLSSQMTLVTRADDALYKAKADGRNRVCGWQEEVFA